MLGIELPNLHRETVFLRELIASGEYEKTRAADPLRKTIGGVDATGDADIAFRSGAPVHKTPKEEHDGRLGDVLDGRRQQGAASSRR